MAVFQRRKKPPNIATPTSPPHNHNHTLTTRRKSPGWKDAKAVALIGLYALKESADAFPPLKSAVGGVLCIFELADAAKSNKKESRQLALRADAILEAIETTVRDPRHLDSDLKARIESFTQLLDELAAHMTDCSKQTFRSRLLHHKETKCSISDFNLRLDQAMSSFMLISHIKLEINVSKLMKSQVELYNVCQTAFT
ncbi:hypothetical protein FIBSPDRAFT_937864 [Athelia psychrophila]|uniref:Uncharacterized protein n=1 Tax=Athelia psychrophila TaxID=1759441 RepID=A0A165ZNB2_9AGAM|nr:hypothetical protein FIBSPDRAFT_937864 [Fibularhizoctonia sp. CBS 109695]